MSSYDFVIIGSGLGGLASGLILAKEGYSVCILEKNRQFGGNLQTFARDKCIFDTGVHYLGGLDEGQNLHTYFKFLGIMDKLKLKRMDENGFDKVTFENDPVEYPHAIGYKNFEKQLSDIFPKHRQEIQRYCQAMQDICDTFPLYRVRESSSTEMKIEYLQQSAYDFMHETISDPKLRDVLSGTIMLYGGDRHKSSVYQHAVTINTYIESSYKCIDGGSQITKALVRNIRDAGGVLMNYADVKQLHSANREIEYAELESGERIYGKKFISNVHPAYTMEMVSEGQMKSTYAQRIKALENSISTFSLHLVFHENTFPYLNYNYYHHFSPDLWDSVRYEKDQWPNGYMVITPATSKSDVYADSMTAMTYMQMRDVMKWEKTFNIIPHRENDRGESYNEFKERCSEKLLTLLEQKFPGIRSKVRSYHTSTPLSYRDYIASPDGSIYGIIKDYNNPISTLLSHRTKIPNLYLTGQNLNTHGILGVTVSAVKTCGEFLGQDYLIRKINGVL